MLCLVVVTRGEDSELPELSSLSVHLDSLLIKDIKRLWPIHSIQTSNMQYAFGVQMYGEVL